jgi:hypothetical protein
MPKMVITHGGADVETWLSFNQERAVAIAAVGGQNPLDLPAKIDSNVVAVMADADDEAVVTAALAWPPAASRSHAMSWSPVATDDLHREVARRGRALE